MSATDMATTFRRAAEVINIGGLNQGTYQQGISHCTVGALMAAKGVEMWNVTSVGPEIGYLAGLLGGADRQPRTSVPGANTVATWNDTKGRTADDVITLLEQAAEKLEADR